MLHTKSRAFRLVVSDRAESSLGNYCWCSCTRHPMDPEQKASTRAGTPPHCLLEGWYCRYTEIVKPFAVFSTSAKFSSKLSSKIVGEIYCNFLRNRISTSVWRVERKFSPSNLGRTQPLRKLQRLGSESWLTWQHGQHCLSLVCGENSTFLVFKVKFNLLFPTPLTATAFAIT